MGHRPLVMGRTMVAPAPGDVMALALGQRDWRTLGSSTSWDWSWWKLQFTWVEGASGVSDREGLLSGGHQGPPALLSTDGTSAAEYFSSALSCDDCWQGSNTFNAPYLFLCSHPNFCTLLHSWAYYILELSKNNCFQEEVIIVLWEDLDYDP